MIIGQRFFASEINKIENRTVGRQIIKVFNKGFTVIFVAIIPVIKSKIETKKIP